MSILSVGILNLYYVILLLLYAFINETIDRYNNDIAYLCTYR